METDPPGNLNPLDMAGRKRGSNESAVPDLISVDPRNSKKPASDVSKAKSFLLTCIITLLPTAHGQCPEAAYARNCVNPSCIGKGTILHHLALSRAPYLSTNLTRTHTEPQEYSAVPGFAHAFTHLITYRDYLHWHPGKSRPQPQPLQCTHTRHRPSLPAAFCTLPIIDNSPPPADNLDPPSPGLPAQQFSYEAEPDDQTTKAVLAIVPPDDCSRKIDLGTIYRSYSTEAAYADLETTLPTTGIKAYGESGPFDVHTFYYDARTIWSTNRGRMTIELPEDKAAKLPAVQVICTLYVHKTELLPSLGRNFSRQYVDHYSIHIFIVLRSRWEFSNIFAHHVRAFWEKSGFLVLNCNRPSHKVSGTAIGKSGYPRKHTIPRPDPGARQDSMASVDVSS